MGATDAADHHGFLLAHTLGIAAAKRPARSSREVHDKDGKGDKKCGKVYYMARYINIEA